MSKSPVIDVANHLKPRKTPAHLRKTQILALEAAGLNQSQIAAKLGVSRRTIVQDLQEIKPAREQVSSLLSDIQSELAQLQTPKQIAENYVELAERAKNEAVRVGAQDKILELRDVVTTKELIRHKQVESPQNQPMFVFQAGAKIDFGGVRIDTTSSKEASLHNASTETPVIDTTTSSNKDEHGS